MFTVSIFILKPYPFKVHSFRFSTEKKMVGVPIKNFFFYYNDFLRLCRALIN